MALRWFLVNTQYRQQVNYTQRALDEASDRVYYAYQSLMDVSQALDAAGEEGVAARTQAIASPCSISNAAILALLDDLNTPSAVSELSAPLKQANDLLTTKAGKKQVGRLVSLARIEAGIKSVLLMLGLLPNETLPVALPKLIGEMKKLALVRSGIDEAFVAKCIQERAEARQAKDFQRADEARIKLSSLGVMIMDTPEGTTWRPGQPSEVK
jgi:cysteinyl-tRNA synthetase